MTNDRLSSFRHPCRRCYTHYCAALIAVSVVIPSSPFSATLLELCHTPLGTSSIPIGDVILRHPLDSYPKNGRMLITGNQSLFLVEEHQCAGWCQQEKVATM